MSSGSGGYAKAVHDRALVARVVRRTPLRHDEGADAAGSARWTPLIGEDGAVLALKAEGVYVPASGDRVYVVADADDHDAPCERCEVELGGAWPGRDAGAGR